jgi:hypothetical protein
LPSRLREYVVSRGGDATSLSGWRLCSVSGHEAEGGAAGGADEGMTVGYFVSPDGKRLHTFDAVCKHLKLPAAPPPRAPPPETVQERGTAAPAADGRCATLPAHAPAKRARPIAPAPATEADPAAVPLSKKVRLGPSGKPVSWF